LFVLLVPFPWTSSQDLLSDLFLLGLLLGFLSDLRGHWSKGPPTPDMFPNMFGICWGCFLPPVPPPGGPEVARAQGGGTLGRFKRVPEHLLVSSCTHARERLVEPLACTPLRAPIREFAIARVRASARARVCVRARVRAFARTSACERACERARECSRACERARARESALALA